MNTSTIKTNFWCYFWFSLFSNSKTCKFVNLLSLAPVSWPPTSARQCPLTPPVCPPLWPHLSLPPRPAKHVLTFSTMGFWASMLERIYSSHVLQRRIGPHYTSSLSAGPEKVFSNRLQIRYVSKQIWPRVKDVFSRMHVRLLVPDMKKQKYSPVTGLEPAIPRSEVWCLIH